MESCKKCLGDGLIGAGEQPWLKQGQIVVCDLCAGTGKLASEPTPEPVAEVAPTEKISEEVPADVSTDGGEKKEDELAPEVPIEVAPTE